MDRGIGSGHPGLGSGLPGLRSGLHDPGATTAAVTRITGFHSVGLWLVPGGVDPSAPARCRVHGGTRLLVPSSLREKDDLGIPVHLNHQRRQIRSSSPRLVLSMILGQFFSSSQNLKLRSQRSVSDQCSVQRPGMSSAVLYGTYPGTSWWQEATPGQRAAALIGVVVLATVVLGINWCVRKAKAKAKAKEADPLPAARNLEMV